MSSEHTQKAMMAAMYTEDVESQDEVATMPAPPIRTTEVPPGYFTSGLFLGTYFAVSVSVMSGVASYAFAAPLLGNINKDIGPDPDIAWVGYTYNLVLACALCLVGRLSDIFGRRWFFIGGNFLALIGTIIAATAKSVPMLIGAMAITSLGAATQISFQYVLGELVPVGKRFIVMATIFPWTMPLGGLGPIIATNLQAHTSLHWRWCFWICSILNALSTLLYVIFYHPPSFRQLEGGKTKWQAIKELDYVGIILFSAGFFIFLMGLTWGGNAHPWKSAAVICTILIGAATLAAFILWEWKAKLTAPYIPFYLFKNFRWVCMMLCLAIGANQYYALALVWPKMILALWPEQAAGNGYGWMACLTGLGLQVGQISGGILANYIKPKAILIVGATGGAALLAAAACANEHNLSTVLGLLIPGFLCIGAQEAITGTFCTIALKNQSDIGVGGGVAATVRAGFSALGSVIYGTVLTNRLRKTIPGMVPPAAIKAGLPATSVTSLVALLQGTGKAAAVKGLTPDILAKAKTAYRSANAIAFRDTMLTTLAFGGLSVLCALFTPEIDQEKAKLVAKTLAKDEKATVQEKEIFE